MSGRERPETVGVRLERDTAGWWTAGLLVALLGAAMVGGAPPALPDDRGGALVLAALGIALLVLARGALRVARTRPQLAFGHRRVVVDDPGLLRTPLSFRTARVEAVYIGPFNARTDPPPWSGMRGRRAVRTFVTKLDRWALADPGPAVRPSVAVPDLSTSTVGHPANFLVLFARPLGVGDHPRRGLGWVDILTRGLNRRFGPFTGTYVRAFLGRVADPDAVAARLAAVVPVHDRPPSEVCEWLRPEPVSFADVTAWLRRRPPPPAPR